jgi:glutathione synthase/RimK-type ligase-like ATP-grasp enzyme
VTAKRQPNQTAGILLAGSSAWAFEELANQLSTLLQLDIITSPREKNYVLAYDDLAAIPSSFIPLSALQIAADKRRVADVFNRAQVPAPKTLLIDSIADVENVLRTTSTQWCLKFPTSCGGAGHRLLNADTVIPTDWPKPFVVQQFIPLAEPQVFRTYIAGANIFGWIVRKFLAGKKASPWVNHARGAVYEYLGAPPPPAAIQAATKAFDATSLTGSFGCADLIQSPTGEWLVLEVGSDGLFNHVDRDLNSPELEIELNNQLRQAVASYISKLE